MKTTFDEALAKIGTYLKNNKRSNENDYKFLLTILDELREEYAPTIEMTKHEKKYLLRYLNNSSFNWLIEDIFSLETDDFEKLSDEDLMQAWLHPETIKIIEEKNNGR